MAKFPMLMIAAAILLVVAESRPAAIFSAKVTTNVSTVNPIMPDDAKATLLAFALLKRDGGVRGFIKLIKDELNIIFNPDFTVDLEVLNDQVTFSNNLTCVVQRSDSTPENPIYIVWGTPTFVSPELLAAQPTLLGGDVLLGATIKGDYGAETVTDVQATTALGDPCDPCNLANSPPFGKFEVIKERSKIRLIKEALIQELAPICTRTPNPICPFCPF